MRVGGSIVEARLSDIAEIEALKGHIPALAQYTGAPERMGGLTNRVYRLGDYVLRLPGQGTEAYIDRKNEAEAARAAAVAGVAPDLIWVAPRAGSW